MENTSKNIQTVAFFFFLVIGLGYLISGLMAANKEFLPLTASLRDTLLLPTIIMGVAYGCTSILESLALEGKNSRIQVATTIGILLLLIAIVLTLHFGFSMKPTT